jgi:hypothetical protein
MPLNRLVMFCKLSQNDEPGFSAIEEGSFKWSALLPTVPIFQN